MVQLEQRCVVYRLPDCWMVFSCARHMGRWLCSGFYERVSLDLSHGDLGRAVESSLGASCATNFIVGWSVTDIARRSGGRVCEAVTVSRMSGKCTIVAGVVLSSPQPLADQVATGDLKGLSANSDQADLGARIRAQFGPIE